MKGNFSKNIPLLVLIGLLLPLFYINVKDSHDWGDDFAQYFIQARNILDGRAQTDNGLVFDRETGEYALQAYPVGFPLILASGWFFFGESVLVSSLTLSLFFFMFALACYFLFRKYFSESISVLLSLVIIYNPLMTGFKKEILSDVPFSFLLLSGILLFNSRKETYARYLLTGIVWGFALSVRGIGAVLLVTSAVLFVANAMNYFRKKITAGEFKSTVKKIFTVVIFSLGFYFLLNTVLFPIPSGSILGFYADAVKGESLQKWMPLNLDYYYQVYLNFFSAVGGSWQWLAAATKYILLLLILPGLIITWAKKPAFEDWLFPVYLLVLFVYPYTGGGFRFLLPVLPVMMKYVFIAISAAMKRINITSSAPALVFLFIILLQYVPGNIEQVHSMELPEQGPEEWQAGEAFEKIKLLPEDAVIVFLKPRALSFYTNRKSAYVTRSTRPAELRDLFARMNAHYFLICNENDEVYDRLLNSYVDENKDRLRILFKNEYFELYSDI